MLVWLSDYHLLSTSGLPSFKPKLFQKYLLERSSSGKLVDISLKQRLMGALSLAISEAFAGSDVMGMKTTATLTEDGKYYIVNGTKKWITNGI